MGQKIKKRRYWRKKRDKSMPEKKIGIIEMIKSLFRGKDDEGEDGKTD